jgi:hypothetical protein
MMFGCAHSPMQFQLAPGTNQVDYQTALKECGGDSKQGGYFLFGPLILLAPAVAVIEGVKHHKRAEVQNCMEAQGFKCISNCPVKSKVIYVPIADTKLEDTIPRRKLFLAIVPSNAKVEIMDFFVDGDLKQAPPFYQGIPLDPGKYNLSLFNNSNLKQG